MRTIELKNGDRIPVIGQGTWRMGEDPSKAAAEIAALRAGIDAGMTLIDTAEMYADGGAERIVGRAIEGRRDDVYVVSKVLPRNSHFAGTIAACEGSLKRLGTDRLDLYLLHWREELPLEPALEAFGRLQEDGKALAFGVSNLDVADMEDWTRIGGGNALVNQVEYSVPHRGIEFDLAPWCKERGIAVQAYCPLAGGAIANGAVARVAARHGATPPQIMLAWCVRNEGMCLVAKSGDPRRATENAAAAGIMLSPEDIAEIDAEFPAPSSKQPLKMT